MDTKVSSGPILSDYASLSLRLSLGSGFISAVADRFGIWGPSGTPSVAWGNFQSFLAYTAKLNPWSPGPMIPVLGWAATLAEILLGIALIVGIRIRIAAFLGGLLTLTFALAMTFVLGIHAPLNYGVFVYSAACFLLACIGPDRWTLDTLLRRGHIHA